MAELYVLIYSLPHAKKKQQQQNKNNLGSIIIDCTSMMIIPIQQFLPPPIGWFCPNFICLSVTKLNSYKADTTLKQATSADPKGVWPRQSSLYVHHYQI